MLLLLFVVGVIGMTAFDGVLAPLGVLKFEFVFDDWTGVEARERLTRCAVGVVGERRLEDEPAAAAKSTDFL